MRTLDDVSSNPEMLSQPRSERNWSQYEELPRHSPCASHSSLEDSQAEEDALLPTAAGHCLGGGPQVHPVADGGGPAEEPADAGVVHYMCNSTRPAGNLKQGYSHGNFKPAFLSDSLGRRGLHCSPHVERLLLIMALLAMSLCKKAGS